jgi:putative spermidine/putrescine transport system permease protein
MKQWRAGAWLLLALPSLAIVVGLFFMPFVRSAITSFLNDAGEFTLQNYATAYRLYAGDVLYTIFVSAVSLVLVLIIAVLVSGFVRIYGGQWVEFLFKIPLFVPYVVVGHAMRVFLAPHGLLNSGLATLGLVNLDHPPSIAYSWVGISVSLAWKNMALAILLTLGAFESVGDTFLEAARNFGAGWFRQVKDVLLPMSATSIAVAAVLIFTSMLASFSIPMMIGGGEGPQMVMIDVYYRIKQQNDLGVANALGVVSYLCASGAAIYYLRSVTKKG